MELSWRIGTREAQEVRALVRAHRQNAFVKARVCCNLRGDRPPLTKTNVWHALTMCLLTTQQRSGPDSRVSRFLRLRPYPLGYRTLVLRRDPAAYAARELTSFGGIRRGATIGRQLESNLEFFSGPPWAELRTNLESLQIPAGYRKERCVAEWLAATIHGLGPKQSRNLLQDLGLTRYETPVDSRVTRWLNETGFPIRLNAVALSDPAYYAFVSDGFRALSKAAGVYPCVLDAVVFSMADMVAGPVDAAGTRIRGGDAR